MSRSASIRYTTVLTALLLITGTVATAAAPSVSPSLARLKHLTEQGQMAQAYQLAVKLEETLAGEPAFDFYYGMAAMETGHEDEAVLALERVLYRNPTNQRVRLEFARALYLLGDNEAAQQAFQRVLESDPPASVAARVKTYLRRIERRQRLYTPEGQLYVELGGGYDSNLNSAPEDQLDLVQLTDASLGKGDAFYNLTLGGYGVYPLNRDQRLRLDANLTRKQYQSEAGFDNQVANLSGSWSIQLDAADRLRAELKAQNYQTEGDTFRNRFALGAHWDHTFSPTLVAGASASLGRLRYPEADTRWRDADQYRAGFHLYTALPVWHQPMLFVNGSLTQERPDVSTQVSDAAANKRSLGVTMGLQLPLNKQHQLVLATSYQHTRYKGEDWLYGVRREDRYRALSFNWRYRLTEQLTLSTALNLSRNRSAIELYDYDRDTLSLNVKYEY